MISICDYCASPSTARRSCAARRIARAAGSPAVRRLRSRAGKARSRKRAQSQLHGRDSIWSEGRAPARRGAEEGNHFRFQRVGPRRRHDLRPRHARQERQRHLVRHVARNRLRLRRRARPGMDRQRISRRDAVHHASAHAADDKPKDDKAKDAKEPSRRPRTPSACRRARRKSASSSTSTIYIQPRPMGLFDGFHLISADIKSCMGYPLTKAP